MTIKVYSENGDGEIEQLQEFDAEVVGRDEDGNLILMTTTS